MTPYTGNPAATQAPSPPPGPAVFPIADLPADSDPPNGATFAQAYKVLADFIAWLMAPFAVIGSWAQAVIIWANALKQPITGIDHFGFLRESAYGWVENWDHSGQYACSGIINRQVGRWQQHITTAGGAIDCPNPGAGFVGGNPFVQQRALRFVTDATTGAVISQSLATDSCGLVLSDDVIVSVEFSLFMSAHTNMTFAFGLAGAGTDPDLSNGSYFLVNTASANFQCQNELASSIANHTTSVAILLNTVFRFRVVVLGKNRDDSSVGRALFFINETEVSGGGITAELPIGTDLVPFMYALTGAGGGADELVMGAPRYRQSIYPGGIF